MNEVTKDRLLVAVHSILSQTDQVVLLRVTDLGPGCIDAGDIDVLIAGARLRTFLNIVDQVTAAKGLHVRVRRTSFTKTRVTIYSADGSHSVDIDLWVELWQVFGGRSFVRYEDLAAHRVDGGLPIPVLAPGLEAAIYLQHLAIKERDVRDPHNRDRLQAMRCRCVDEPAMRDAIDRVLARGGVLESSVAAAEGYLSTLVEPDLEKRARWVSVGSLPRRWAQRRLRSRSLPGVALVGVDGCGKTSLSEGLADESARSTLLAKLAYRRSRLFRAIYKINRSTTKLAYEPIDNTLAALAYASATRRLPVLVDENTILDRYLADFGIRDRKTDTPSHSRLSPILRWWHRPCRVVHIQVQWATIERRKNEVTRSGHAWYDQAVRRYYCSFPIVDYTTFRNDADYCTSLGALRRLVDIDEATRS